VSSQQDASVAGATADPTQRLRRYYPVAVVVVLVLMAFASTLVPHTMAAFGLSLVTTSVLLLSAKAFEALLAPVVKDELRQFWRRVYDLFSIVLIGTGLAGIGLMIWGACQGKLHTAGSTSQYHYILGAALLAIVVFALIPIWLARVTLDITDGGDGEETVTGDDDEAERPNWALLVGSLLFISGTLLQFIALTQRS
jgi:hypothetical protein